MVYFVSYSRKQLQFQRIIGHRMGQEARQGGYVHDILESGRDTLSPMRTEMGYILKASYPHYYYADEIALSET
jgi:hypothetical protein